MSADAEETLVRETDEGRRRPVAATSRQARVAHTQAVIIGGLGVALSCANAIEENTFRGGRSPAHDVFYMAIVVKTLGLLVALFYAWKVFRNGDNDFGSGGSPIMMIWGAKSTGEDPRMCAAAIGGFGLQAIAIWTTFWTLFFGVGLGALIGLSTVKISAHVFWTGVVSPTIRYFQDLLADPTQSCPVQCCPRDRRQIPARASCSALAVVVVTGPVVVYSLESAAVFASEATEIASYTLAVLDLVTVVLALPFVCSFVYRVVPQLWGGEFQGEPGTGPIGHHRR